MAKVYALYQNAILNPTIFIRQYLVLSFLFTLSKIYPLIIVVAGVAKLIPRQHGE